MMFSSSLAANARDRLPSNSTWNTIRLVNSMMRRVVYSLFRVQGDMLISDGVVALISLYTDFRNGIHDEFLSLMRAECPHNEEMHGETDLLTQISKCITESSCSTLLEFLCPFIEYSVEKAHVWLSLVLDPRYKRLRVARELESSFPDEFNVRTLNKRYEKVLLECLVRARQFLHPEGDDSHDSDSSDFSDNDDFEEYQDLHFMGTDSFVFVRSEFIRYREVPLLESSKNALDWWRKNAHLFPTIAVVSRLILGIPCSQCECERTFSIAGLLSQNRRNNISVDNMDHVIKINKNLANFERFEPQTVSDFDAFLARETELLEMHDNLLENVDDVNEIE